MQSQSLNTFPLTLKSNIGFVYNSQSRTFSCLGQYFENVSLCEMEIYREIAICNYNNNSPFAKELRKKAILKNIQENPSKPNPVKPKTRIKPVLVESKVISPAKPKTHRKRISGSVSAIPKVDKQSKSIKCKNPI